MDVLTSNSMAREFSTTTFLIGALGRLTMQVSRARRARPEQRAGGPKHNSMWLCELQTFQIQSPTVVAKNMDLAQAPLSSMRIVRSKWRRLAGCNKRIAKNGAPLEAVLLEGVPQAGTPDTPEK